MMPARSKRSRCRGGVRGCEKKPDPKIPSPVSVAGRKAALSGGRGTGGKPVPSREAEPGPSPAGSGADRPARPNFADPQTAGAGPAGHRRGTEPAAPLPTECLALRRKRAQFSKDFAFLFFSPVSRFPHSRPTQLKSDTKRAGFSLSPPAAPRPGRGVCACMLRGRGGVAQPGWVLQPGGVTCRLGPARPGTAQHGAARPRPPRRQQR